MYNVCVHTYIIVDPVPFGTYNAHVHTYIIVDPVPCGKTSRVAFIGRNIRQHFEGSGISTNYGMYTSTVSFLVPSH